MIFSLQSIQNYVANLGVGQGGGMIQDMTSEVVLVFLLAALDNNLRRLGKKGLEKMWFMQMIKTGL